MASQDARPFGRPYRKASEYLAQKQPSSVKTMKSLEDENEQLRERLAGELRKLETMEVEYDQSREFFVTELQLTKQKLKEKSETLVLMQRNFAELQGTLYELQEKNSKIIEIEKERDYQRQQSMQSLSKLEELTHIIQRLKKDNQRLREECQLAVSLLQCNQGNSRPPPITHANVHPGNCPQNHLNIDLSKYNEHVNPYMDDSDADEAPYQDASNRHRITQLGRKFAEAGDQPRSVVDASRLVKFEEQKSPIYRRIGVSTGTEPSASEPRAKTTSSPWERQDCTNTSNEKAESKSSPWVHNPSEIPGFRMLRFNEFVDRYSPAEIYGATPIMYPKRIEEGPNYEQILSMTGKMKLRELRYIAGRPKKGTGENRDVYIAEEDPPTPILDSPLKKVNSNESSRKSTPNKVPTSTERGSKAEKSSLLEAEDEEIVMLIEEDMPTGSKFVTKSVYRGQLSEAEGHGLLARNDDLETEEKNFIAKETTVYLTDPGQPGREDDVEVGGLDSTSNKDPTGIDHKVKKEELELVSEDVNLMALNEILPPMPQTAGFTDKPRNSNFAEKSLATLADIPPPDMTTVVCDAIEGASAPPPPMFMGNFAGIAVPPPYNHPMPYSSSTSRISQPLMTSQVPPVTQRPPVNSPNVSEASQSSSMMSQPPTTQQKQEDTVTSPSNPLDDLTSVVQKEFESAQSPKKSANATQESQPIDMPPSGDNSMQQNVGDELNEAAVQTNSTSIVSDPNDSLESEVPDVRSSISHVDQSMESGEFMSAQTSFISPPHKSILKEHVEVTGGEYVRYEVAEDQDSPEAYGEKECQTHTTPTAPPELLV